MFGYTLLLIGSKYVTSTEVDESTTRVKRINEFIHLTQRRSGFYCTQSKLRRTIIINQSSLEVALKYIYPSYIAFNGDRDMWKSAK